jgi:hypothetical protein
MKGCVKLNILLFGRIGLGDLSKMPHLGVIEAFDNA